MAEQARQCVRILIAWLLLAATMQVRAQSGQVAILLSDNGAEYQQVSSEIVSRLGKRSESPPRVQTLDVGQSGADDLRSALSPAPDLLITVGTRATRLALAQGVDIPTLAVFIPKLSFDALLAAFSEQASRKAPSAIFLDQPIERQIALARAIIPAGSTLGVIAGPQARTLLDEVRPPAQAAELKLKTLTPSSKDRLAEHLNGELTGINLLLPLFDPLLMDRRAVTQILYAAYGKSLPVLGYSEAMVNAGAVAAAFSDAKQIGRHAAEVIESALSTPAARFGAPRYPKYFRVACNPSVARYLDLERACDPELPGRLGAER